MDKQSKAKDALEQILAGLYQQQASNTPVKIDSYLLASNGQFLGYINSNKYDPNSLINEYGPYGSPYSTTSIFNPYSLYGSEYSLYSVNNPFTINPPQFYLNNIFKGYVSKNNNILNVIATEAFLYTLKNNINHLLSGNISYPPVNARIQNCESFIEAADGTYLGSLVPNPYNPNSIFNAFSPYGNQYSPHSIFNHFNRYRNQFHTLSADNPYSSSPPKIFVNGRHVAFLTINKNFSNGIPPGEILDWAKKNVSYHSR